MGCRSFFSDKLSSKKEVGDLKLGLKKLELEKLGNLHKLSSR